MSTEIQRLGGQVVLAVVNGVYQGVLLTLVLAGLLRLAGRTNAATRHAFWLAGLLLVVLIVPAHVWLDRKIPVYPRVPAVQEEQTTLRAPVLRALSSLSLDPAALDPVPVASSKGLGTSPDGAANPVPRAFADAAPLLEGWEPSRGTGQGAAAGVQGQAGTEGSPVSTGKPPRAMRAWAYESAPGLAAVFILLTLWIFGAIAQLGLLGCRLWQLRRLSADSTAVAAELQELFERLRNAAGVRRKVGLRLSARQRGPAVLGFRRPIILLPVSMGEDLDALRQVLCHELAHVRRYDDWVNLLQHFVQALFFFHPSVWWIGRRLSLEREIACDDHVLEQGGSRRSYALVLANVAGQMSRRAPLLAPGVSNHRSQLQQRITMILNKQRNASPCPHKGRVTSTIAAATVLAGLALAAAPRMLLAGPPAPSSGSSTESAVAAPALAGSPIATVVSGPGLAAVVAEAAPDSDAAPGISSGPKAKPEPGLEGSEPVEAAAPEPPALPDANPKNSAVPRARKPRKLPRIAEAPEAPDVRFAPDASVEERLRRLEKMVRALMEGKDVKRSHGMLYSPDGDALKFNLDQQPADKLKDLAEQKSVEKQVELQKRLADRQAARASEQAQRAADQARRVSKDLEARLDQERDGMAGQREDFQHELESLRKAREDLGREMDRLSRQIEKLERRQDPLRRGEAPKAEMRARTVPSPSAVR